MTKFKNITLSLIFTALFCLSACKCNTVKPWDYTDVAWISQSPYIEISNLPNSYLGGIIVINETNYQVELIWGPSDDFGIIDVSTLNENDYTKDSMLLKGRFEYDYNSVTLIIEEDYIFDYKYDKIVLYRKDLPKDE